MFKSLKDQLFKRARQLQILDKINERKALTRAHKVIEELAGKDSARPLHIKQGVLLVQCKNPTTAHFLRMNENRIKMTTQVNSVRFFS